MTRILPRLRSHKASTPADTSISKNSWGYAMKQDYKAATTVIHDFIDIVSKNGALLVNIGPRPDGTVPEPEIAVLLELGGWLGVNGEAIYGSRPWHHFGEGPTEIAEGAMNDTKRSAFTSEHVRFTTKGDTLYAICLGWPEREWSIASLGTGAGKISRVSLLGCDEKPTWSQAPGGLRVSAPARKPCEHACTLRISIQK